MIRSTFSLGKLGTADIDINAIIKAMGINGDNVTVLIVGEDMAQVASGNAGKDLIDGNKFMAVIPYDNGFLVTLTTKFDMLSLDADNSKGVFSLIKAIETKVEYTLGHIIDTNTDTVALFFRPTVDGIEINQIKDAKAIALKRYADGTNVWFVRHTSGKVAKMGDVGMKNLIVDGDTSVYDGAKEMISGNFVPVGSGHVSVWNKCLYTFELGDNDEYTLVGSFDQLAIPTIGSNGGRTTDTVLVVDDTTVTEQSDPTTFFGDNVGMVNLYSGGYVTKTTDTGISAK